LRRFFFKSSILRRLLLEREELLEPRRPEFSWVRVDKRFGAALF